MEKFHCPVCTSVIMFQKSCHLNKSDIDATRLLVSRFLPFIPLFQPQLNMYVGWVTVYHRSGTEPQNDVQIRVKLLGTCHMIDQIKLLYLDEVVIYRR